jgi:hypothetical protein
VKNLDLRIQNMILAGLLLFASVGNAAPVVYTTEASFKAALEAVGYSRVSESFENDTVWAASRNSRRPTEFAVSGDT